MSDAVPAHFDDEGVRDAAPVSRVVGEITNPFQRARSQHLSEGSVAIESERAIAEAQGKLILAKRFPRDEGLAFDKLMDACSRPGLAAIAFYKYSRGGTVEGPSIRLAEEMQRCWGNMESGLRELSRKPGLSEMEAFAWEYETNNLSTQRFTVRHIRDRNEGNLELTAERDIYEITANMGQRRVRARILAVLPSDLVQAAIYQCKKTVAGDTKVPLADRIKGMIMRFKDVGVTAEMLATHLTHPLDETTPDEIVDLTGIYNSIKEGASKASEWFGAKAVTERPGSKLDALQGATETTQDKPGATKETTKQPEKSETSDQPDELMDRTLDLVRQIGARTKATLPDLTNSGKYKRFVDDLEKSGRMDLINRIRDANAAAMLREPANEAA